MSIRLIPSNAETIEFSVRDDLAGKLRLMDQDDAIQTVLGLFQEVFMKQIPTKPPNACQIKKKEDGFKFVVNNYFCDGDVERRDEVSCSQITILC